MKTKENKNKTSNKIIWQTTQAVKTDMRNDTNKEIKRNCTTKRK